MPSHPVALSEFGSSLSPLVLAHRALDDPLILVVVALELARGMYFQVPIRLCACVAEGVVDPPRLEDERAGRGDHDLAADVERQLALQHEGALVLSRVGVRREHRARWEAYLDDRKGAAEALRCHLVGYVQDGEVGTFSWTDEDFLVLCRHKALAPFRSASLMQALTLPMQAGCQLERVMNSISNGLGMRETETTWEPSRPWNPYLYAIFAQVHNTLYKPSHLLIGKKR